MEASSENKGQLMILERCDESSSSAVYSNNGSKLSSVTDTRGTVTSYEYDSNNRLQSAVTVGNTTTTYTYDSYDRIKTVSSQESTVGYNYNINNLASIVSPSGTQYGFTYDVQRQGTVSVKPKKQ